MCRDANVCRVGVLYRYRSVFQFAKLLATAHHALVYHSHRSLILLMLCHLTLYRVDLLIRVFPMTSASHTVERVI